MLLRNWEDYYGDEEQVFTTVQSKHLSEISATATTTPGDLSGTENYDLIEVNLTAGQRYTFDYRGTVDGVSDPYLALFGPGFGYITEDDDGGYGRSSQITYTASTTGTYYLYVTSWYTLEYGDATLDTGDYTINIWSPEADVPGSTNITASIATAVAIPIGTYYGNIDFAGDNDYYAVEVEAGMVYSFAYSGGVSGSGDFNGEAGENLATVRVYNASGTQLSSNLNYESGTSYYAATDGVVYVRVTGYQATTGGYTLDVGEIDPSTRDPLEAFIWDSANNVEPDAIVDGVPTVYVYFGAAGESFGTGEVTLGWTQAQIDAVMSALNDGYTPVTGYNYVITTDVEEATFRMQTVSNNTYGARFYPQDPAYGALQGIGSFNIASGGFGTDPNSLLPGGYSYAVILHELGHAHGIAHPHDTGGGSEIMLGVTASTNSYGVYDLNQGVYSVMSYNDGWNTHPDGDRNYSAANRAAGWSATLGAFDIAVMQERGYITQDNNVGDTVYTLSDSQATANYQTILDSSGTDTIAYVGSRDAQIDLLAATLDYNPTGGGVVSFARGVWGGYTIANGVVIENATGGSGNDVLLGNDANNVLTGNVGNDSLMGRGGLDTANYANASGGVTVNLADGTATGADGTDTLDSIENIIGSAFDDTLIGNAGANNIVAGGGADTVTGGDGLDVVTLGAGDDTFIAEFGTTKTTLKTGTMSVDIITDFDGSGNDVIDVSGLGLTFKGTAANKNASDLTYKTYTSVNGAENALGFDIDGQPGASGVSGPVTVVYGNNNGGSPDFAIILLNTSSVDASDFLFGTSSALMASSGGGGYLLV